MKTVILGAMTALALTLSANAQDAGFISKQEMGTVRAPKLVGVSVYDNANKSVGKIDDLLLDKDGKINAVVIGVGGFLGIGKKDVAVPFSALKWQTEERTVAVNDANGAAPAAGTTMANGTTTGTAGTNNGAGMAPANDQVATKKVDPAATEAYQGYPDRAIIAMSQDQLKAAPEFKYADNPRSSMTTDTASPAATKP